jgi:sporulation protein YlmC with PRC-barrel domain
MHPPVHRLLGWATCPSKLSLKRNVWRLNQLRAITYQDALVKGLPAESDQATINRFPTLIDAVLLNIKGEKIGNIADLIFETKTGNISYYLVSRSNPKIPGTSRWRLDLKILLDQEPGCVSTNIMTIDELPLIKSSIRQDILKKSKKIKENLLEISNIANQRLEGWLDEQPLENYNSDNFNFRKNISWLDDENFSSSDKNNINLYNENEEDPWI